MGDFKKLSGRPELKSGKRVKKIDARFTEEEYKTICALETELGVSKTELVRMRLLNNAQNVIINAKELIRHLDEIGAEMGRVGNNINQLAKHTNFLKLQGHIPPSTAGKFIDLFEEYIAIQQKLQISLRKIIRSTGS